MGYKIRKVREPKTNRRQWDPTQIAANVKVHQVTKSYQHSQIPKSTLWHQEKRIRERAEELQLAPDDPQVFQHRRRPGRGSPWTKETEDKICNWVVSNHERRRMKSQDIIEALDLPGAIRTPNGEKRKMMSKSKLNSIMYKRGYRRGACGWESGL